MNCGSPIELWADECMTMPVHHEAENGQQIVKPLLYFLQTRQAIGTHYFATLQLPSDMASDRNPRILRHFKLLQEGKR